MKNPGYRLLESVKISADQSILGTWIGCILKNSNWPFDANPSTLQIYFSYTKYCKYNNIGNAKFQQNVKTKFIYKCWKYMYDVLLLGVHTKC